jgi:hypothetical protein
MNPRTHVSARVVAIPMRSDMPSLDESKTAFHAKLGFAYVVDTVAVNSKKHLGAPLFQGSHENFCRAHRHFLVSFSTRSIQRSESIGSRGDSQRRQM